MTTIQPETATQPEQPAYYWQWVLGWLQYVVCAAMLLAFALVAPLDRGNWFWLAMAAFYLLDALLYAPWWSANLYSSRPERARLGKLLWPLVLIPPAAALWLWSNPPYGWQRFWAPLLAIVCWVGWKSIADVQTMLRNPRAKPVDDSLRRL